MSRSCAAVLALTLLVVQALPAAAAEEPDLVNDEVAIATLDPAGLPIDARLVSRTTSGTGPERLVADPASTTNATYLDRRGTPGTAPGAQLVPVGGPTGGSVLTEALFDKPMPVALHAQYALDGAVVAPAAVPGATGPLQVTYTVTNTSVVEQEVSATDAAGVVTTARLPVFVPFAGTMAVTVPAGSAVLDAPGAASSTDTSGRTVLTFDLLLAPPVGDFQVRRTITLATGRAAVPGVVVDLAPATGQTDPALAFGGSLVAGSTDAARQLAGGLAELDTQTGRLAQGAGVLGAGAQDLAGGAGQLAGALGTASAGTDPLAAGAQGLATGLGRLTGGLDQLAGPDGLPLAADSARRLAAGAGALAEVQGSGAQGPWRPEVVLPPGLLPAPPNLPAELPQQWRELLERLAALPRDIGFAPDGRARDGVCDLDTDGDGRLDTPVVDPDCAPTVVQALRLLDAGAEQAARIAAQVVPLLASATGSLAVASTDAAEAAAQAQAAATGARDLQDQACGSPPVLSQPQCDALAEVERSARSAAAAATGSGQQIATAQADVAAAALRSAGLAAGLPLLSALLGLTADAAARVGDGLRSGDPAAPGLVEGLDALAAGLGSASGAAAQLAAGGAAAGSGADALAAGTRQLQAGLTQAADGADRLSGGADLLAGGAETLAAGASQLQEQGTSAVLREVVESSKDPALAQAYLAATDARAADALPYGAPAGATGTARYVLDLPPVLPQTAALPWAWLLAATLLAVGAASAQRRLTGVTT